ncbi:MULTISPECIES: thiamine-phosphate kinase [Actinomadura]|jgi:thiamine-monophosphate kinase|uniref:Thiamine-monophosphate kinase n=1 Tax=Actinomadura geliboluensis TaxID=882440 RepID=A0A5S4GLA7_9ACTN|nr:thiamine-phosphate kinase [Actinomadura geliboluensis]TMR33609.1 thiamine-phosphate kinase [Actinomadura geliboluensis]
MGTIGELGEFGLIDRLTRRLPQGPAVRLGPGDDAAVVAAPDGRVVATTDLLVQGRHFRLDWSGPYDIGRKAAAQNLADVVAMGARPTALLVGFAAPPETPADWAEALYDGLADECRAAGASVAGGDVVSAPRITLAITALGDLGGAAPLTRSGARPGDAVAVRGRLGYASAGLALLTEGRDGPAELIAAHRRPEPPYEAGDEARAHGATALLDVSDGLVQDLGHIADAGGVRIEIDSAAVPVPEILGPDGLRHALTGGEDHAFAATFPGAVPASWSRIGTVAAGSGVRVDGREPPPGAWDHFAV